MDLCPQSQVQFVGSLTMKWSGVGSCLPGRSIPAKLLVKNGVAIIERSEKMKSADEHRKKMLERQSQLLSDLLTGDIEDTDIWNLEMMITEIAPGSRAWRSGHIRSLRRAIKALKRENQERRQAICEQHIDPG